MKIIILTISIFLLNFTTATNAANGQRYLDQKFCISIDPKAKNSRWTGRDNTAKMQVKGEYRSFSTYRKVLLGPSRMIEAYYNYHPHCESFQVDGWTPPRTVNDTWHFNSKFRVGLQYGGDCWFDYAFNKTVHITIHHRRGDLVNPWSCTTRAE